MAAVELTRKDTLYLKETFGGAGGKTLELNPVDDSDSNKVTYLGDIIKQGFSKIFVHNLSDFQLVYSIIGDDSVTVVQAGGDGMITLPAGDARLDDIGIVTEVKLDLAGAGDVEIVLHAR